MITHADKVAERVVSDLRQSYLTITPSVSVIDLRSVIESRPYDRGQQWRSLLEELKSDLQTSDTPTEVVVSREIKGFDQLRYTKAGKEKLLLLPQSGVDVLKPLTESFDLLREHKPIVITQEIESILKKHQQQILGYKNRLLNYLDTDKSKLTVYTKDAINEVLSSLIEQVIQPHLIDNLVKGSFTVRNLTDAEASYWFTPYAGVFLDDLSSSWLRHNLALLFKRPIGPFVAETLKHLAPSTSGDAFNQELFDRFFADFDTVTLTLIQDNTVAEWVALSGQVLEQYENIEEARAQSTQFKNQLRQNMKEGIINHIQACYTESCENYGAGLEASLQSVYQHQLERVEIVKHKARLLAKS